MCLWCIIYHRRKFALWEWRESSKNWEQTLDVSRPEISIFLRCQTPARAQKQTLSGEFSSRQPYSFHFIKSNAQRFISLQRRRVWSKAKAQGEENFKDYVIKFTAFSCIFMDFTFLKTQLNHNFYLFSKNVCFLYNFPKDYSF